MKILGQGWTRRFSWLITGLLIASLLEVMSLAVIYPFLKALIGGGGQGEFDTLTLCIGFCLAMVASSFFRVYVSWLSGKFAFGIGKDIAQKIYKNFITLSYEKYQNTSLDIFSTSIAKKVDILVQQSILPSVVLMVNVLICLGIISLIMYVDVILSFYLGFFILLCYLIIGIISKKKLLFNGKNSSQKLIELNQILDISYAGFLENKIYSNDLFFYKRFIEIYNSLNESQRKLDIMRIYPRYFIEASGVIFLLLCGYLMILNGKKLESVLPILGVTAFAAQRLFPCAQQIYNSWSAIKSTEPIYKEIFALLIEKNDELKVDLDHVFILKNIIVDNVIFKYQDAEYPILNKINFKFEIGDRIGIIGPSGSGKSTFLKLLLGLIEPDEGHVYLNSDFSMSLHRKNLWKKVSYISQNLSIYPGTIIENIAIGCAYEDVDFDCVIRVSKSAKIFDFINNLPLKFDTKIGGVNFTPSHGQVQRIILARALYRNPDLLILDEFTSALDSNTEAEIVEEIMELFKNKSIIMISHKEKTLRLCSRIFQLKNERIIIV
jgi:ATP-binding cassette subfamily B protein